MKRTRKMMLVTLLATTAVAMLLMSRAYAAPASDEGCQVTNGTAAKAANCPATGLVRQIRSGCFSLPCGMERTLTAAAFPSSADLSALIARIRPRISAGMACKMNSTATPAPAPTATAAPTKTPAPAMTAAPTMTPVPTATAAPTKTPVPTKSPAPTATPAPQPGSMSAEESKMINLVNQERTAAGLKALTFDGTLRVPAIKHSQDMSQNNFFSHTSPTHGTFSQRLKASGVKYAGAGENLAMYGSVEKAHVGLMNSEGHRANIMNPNFTRIGIGIVYNQSRGTYYITQWFAR